MTTLEMLRDELEQARLVGIGCDGERDHPAYQRFRIIASLISRAEWIQQEREWLEEAAVVNG
jgi:hypothetical protein